MFSLHLHCFPLCILTSSHSPMHLVKGVLCLYPVTPRAGSQSTNQITSALRNAYSSESLDAKCQYLRVYLRERKTERALSQKWIAGWLCEHYSQAY